LLLVGGWAGKLGRRQFAMRSMIAVVMWVEQGVWVPAAAKRRLVSMVWQLLVEGAMPGWSRGRKAA
jgi:hypothetical protein